jgi:hypothetical protein
LEAEMQHRIDGVPLLRQHARRASSLELLQQLAGEPRRERGGLLVLPLHLGLRVRTNMIISGTLLSDLALPQRRRRGPAAGDYASSHAGPCAPPR